MSFTNAKVAVAVVLTTQRKRYANSNKNSTTALIKTPSHASQPHADSAGQAGNQQLDAELNDSEGARQHRKLNQQAACRIKKLGQKRDEEQNHLGIADGRQRSLAKQ